MRNKGKFSWKNGNFSGSWNWKWDDKDEEERLNKKYWKYWKEARRKINGPEGRYKVDREDDDYDN